MESDSKQEERKKNFKQINAPELSNIRENYSIMLRKNKRDAEINAKRMSCINELVDISSEEEIEKLAITKLIQREPSLSHADISIVFFEAKS